MCVGIWLVEGDEGRDIATQGELAALVGLGRIVFLPGHKGYVHEYSPDACLCPVNIPASLEPEHTVERDEWGDYRVERAPC